MTFTQLGIGVMPDGIGGKGAAWWRFHCAGANVPDGFVVLPGEDLEDDRLRDALHLLVSRCGCTALAVRSSGATEDGEEASLAGLFVSLLDVPADVTAVRNAVEECRRSGQSARARAALGRAEEPCVLVQEMVLATWSGLLFSRDPHGAHDLAELELVRGHLRGLVDGAPPDLRVRLDPEGQARVGALLGPTAVEWLLELARTAEDSLDGPADIEWALTERGLVLLQARLITGIGRRRSGLEVELIPVGHAHADRMPHDVRQHDKVALRLLAESLGIPISRGFIALCKQPWNEHVEDLARELRTWGEFMAVLLSPFHWNGKILRKIGVGPTAADVLRGCFHELSGHRGPFALLLKELQPTARTGVAVRLADGRVLAEVTRGHFITKGIAGATGYFLSESGDKEHVREGGQESMTVVEHGKARTVRVDMPARLSDDELVQLRDVLQKLSAHHPEAGIEFGYTPGGEFFLVDLYESPAVAPTFTNYDVLSSGRIVGRVRYLDLDDGAVEESIARHVHDSRDVATAAVAEPEIVVVNRPYHHLDSLVYAAAPNALGFVCEDGSLLCHLAVVMREKGIPGLLLPGVRALVRDGDRAVLDTRPGTSVMFRKL